MKFNQKKILVVGLGKSGLAVVRYLVREGATVTVSDVKKEENLDPGAIREMRAMGVTLETGGHRVDTFTCSERIILSPGVPLDLAPLAVAKEKGIPVTGEMDLAVQMMNTPIVAVTGTNGKSTVTTLVGLMLAKAGKKVLVAGNIGNALTEDVAQLRGQDWIVAELSSFQLEDIETFRPRVAAILNVTQDHLDRYHDLAEYSEAKARVFMNQQKDDILVLNFDDPEVKAFAQRTAATIVPFSRLLRFNPGACVVDGHLLFNNQRVVRTDEIRIKGVHNLENALAAAAVSLIAGADIASVAAVLKEYPGLEHRLEFVRKRNGVTYINDSKGTNVGAVVKSVEGFTHPVILIAGGLDKGSDFSPLYNLFAEKVKLLVLIGKAADKMEEALGSATETVRAASLEEAVRIAAEQAALGDVVLLSPACASFDMFKDFEDRGRKFKEAVKKL